MLNLVATVKGKEENKRNGDLWGQNEVYIDVASDSQCCFANATTYRHDLLFRLRNFGSWSFSFPQAAGLRSIGVRGNCEEGEAESLAGSKTFSLLKRRKLRESSS